ncbi:MAG TPA: hypothetical protein VFE45_02920, partial [Coriobacteriia bacterium]|nr:hypothetical protein [Coriobacteriia bacterium]
HQDHRPRIGVRPDPRRQAIYIFQRDRHKRSRCYGACAEAWPPVFTRGEPIAGRGVRSRSLAPRAVVAAGGR